MADSAAFRPVSKERAEQLKRMLADSRNESLNIDPETGKVTSDSLDNAEASQINAIGKFDTHYSS